VIFVCLVPHRFGLWFNASNTIKHHHTPRLTARNS
jgi:hypothetical protein